MNQAQQQVIDRIRKLLRLSRGTNHAAEAAAAMAKAAAIAQEAGLSIDGIDADSTTPRITHEAGGAMRCTHSRKRCHVILRKHFGVDVVGSSDRGAIYIGPAINIALARHIEIYLVRQCAAGWARNHELLRRLKNKLTARGRRLKAIEARRAYEYGFYAGIDEVLAARPIRNDLDALSGAIERYVADNFKITMVPIGKPSKVDQNLLNGYAAGRSTRCDRPVATAAAPMAIAGGAA